MVKTAVLQVGKVYFYNPDTHVVSDYNPYMKADIGRLRAFTATGKESLDGQNRIGGKPVPLASQVGQNAPPLEQVLKEEQALVQAGVVADAEIRRAAIPSDAAIPQPVNTAELPQPKLEVPELPDDIADLLVGA